MRGSVLKGFIVFSSQINIARGGRVGESPCPHSPASINHPEYRQHLSSFDVSDRSASLIKLGGKGKKADPREQHGVRSFCRREKNAGLCGAGVNGF